MEPEPQPAAADVAELQALIKKGDAAAENLDVPELHAMESAAELYQQAMDGFTAAGLSRPKLQAKLDSANDRIADLLLSAPAPAAAVDWDDFSDSGVLAQLQAIGCTGALACTEIGKDISSTFDEASAFGAWDLTQEMSASAFPTNLCAASLIRLLRSGAVSLQRSIAVVTTMGAAACGLQ